MVRRRSRGCRTHHHEPWRGGEIIIIIIMALQWIDYGLVIMDYRQAVTDQRIWEGVESSGDGGQSEDIRVPDTIHGVGKRDGKLGGHYSTSVTRGRGRDDRTLETTTLLGWMQTR